MWLKVYESDDRIIRDGNRDLLGRFGLVNLQLDVGQTTPH